MGKKRNLGMRIVLAVLALVLISGVAAAQYHQHRVQRGETLSTIADQYGMTWQDIAVVNNITNPSRIYPGQMLNIPSGSTSSTTQVIYTMQTYTVNRGDSLTAVANQFGISLDTLVSANNVTRTSQLMPGQVLNVPGSRTIVRPVQPIVRPPLYGNRYTVQHGDTMFRIASWYGVNVYDLAEANGILNLNLIYTGQSLVIPGR